MAKVKVKNWPGLEIEFGESKHATGQSLFEKEAGLDLESKEAKAKRQKIFDDALHIRREEKQERPLSESEIREGRDVRERNFMRALGVKTLEEKAPEKKDNDNGESLLESTRAALADLRRTLATHGVKDFPALSEAEKSLTELEISLKESATDDDDPEEEYTRQSRGLAARRRALKEGRY